MKKRTVKIIAIVVGILLIVFIILGFIIGNIFYNLALNPLADKSAVFGADHNQLGERPIDPEQGARETWLESVTLDNRYMASHDGLNLHSYVIEQNGNNSDLWAILCHGYMGEASSMTNTAWKFHEKGYNILMPNARGHAESEGSYVGMGWDERLDIVDWINQIIEWDPDAQIVLYGISMGGATVMMVSGEDLPDHVKVIVEDCGYSSIWGEFSYQLKMLFNLPDFPIMHFSSLVTKIRAGWWISDGDTISQVSNSKTPMMFIHGDSDSFVPSYMLDEVYEAANVPKEKLYVEGANHGGSASVLGDEYWERVFGFITKYID